MKTTEQEKAHWDQAYRAREADRHSWFQARPERSLAMIHAAGTGPDDAIIDVGGGASGLVDALLQQGFNDLTVLDVSQAALRASQRRLAEAAGRVHWLCADIRDFQPLRTYRLWHDRALFHFLVREQDRAQYRRALKQAVPAGGQVVMATFAIGGPKRCSGLDIEQYDERRLGAALGAEFHLQEQGTEAHRTPGGGVQSFAWFRFQRQ